MPALLVGCALTLVVGPVAHRAPAAIRVWGVDVASYQHPGGAGIDWRAVRRDGASFAIIKATEGTTYKNPFFAGDWQAARAAHLVRGAYDFARPAMPLTTAVSQASAFVATAGTTRENGDLPPILDLEVSGGLSPSELVNWTHTWLATTQALTGRTPILYTGQYFWYGALGNARSFTGFPLWLAAYQWTSPPAPYSGGWRSWTLWQYTSQAAIPGIAGGVDVSDFCCGQGGLAGLADGRNTLIARKWASLGGGGGILGAATDAERRVRGGWMQTYAHGVIVYTPPTGAHAVVGRSAATYLRLGGPNAMLGAPTADTLHRPSGDQSVFVGGQVLAARGQAAHAVTGAILAGWLTAGGIRGGGYPTTDAMGVGGTARHVVTLAVRLNQTTTGVEQDFAAGDWFSSPPTGTHEVLGPILAAYAAYGGANGALGLPVGDRHAVTGGYQIDFQVGSIRYLTALRRALLV